MTYFTTGAQLSDAIAALPDSKKGGFLAFDQFFYGDKYMGSYSGTLSPLEHFVQIGADRGYAPSAQFDPAYYASAYADLTNAHLNSADLLYHFLQFGLDEGRAPNPSLAAFNGAAYLAAYPDVAAYVDANLAEFGGSASNGALAHYVKFGQFEGRAAGEPVHAGQTFTLTDSTLGAVPAELKVMHLVGDQDVRIEFTTNPNKNQITGLDVNGNGAIGNDGKENSLLFPTVSGMVDGAAKGYGAVDAYTRMSNGVVNESDLTSVFLGDIKYDGTGFKGDGVKSNGNIVLGGLGADTILTGLGNDFIAGGGVALSRNGGMDNIAAGRNSDFIFAELSLLSNTDGNSMFIDGGSSADDTSASIGQSAQDSDWLLLQASDDDEPVTINLREDPQVAVIGTVDPADPDLGTLFTRAGQRASLRDIENVDASGNTYGFIKGLDTTLGGAPTNADNNGIGSSAQLRINGSEAANIIIGGYDNDAIFGNAGNDILMGGNLSKLIDPNLVGLVGDNDGMDYISGGAGNDAIVLELDGGTAAGDEGDDTLFLTNFTAGSSAAPAATEATSLAAVLADDLNDGVVAGRIRLDLAYDSYRGYRGDTLGEYTDHSDEANATSTSNHVAGTADQTNYKSGKAATTVTGIENVIATGLGQIDYKAAGSNTATDVTFANQQNFFASNANLELRGTDGGTTEFLTLVNNGGMTPAAVTALYAQYLTAFLASQADSDLSYNDPLSAVAFESALENGGIELEALNLVETLVTVATGNNTLYANSGEDILEGRTGNDKLSGGEGADDFVFSLSNETNSASQYSSGIYNSFNVDRNGDDVDVIHRQTDKVNASGATVADNIWDGTFEQDFGTLSSNNDGKSYLYATFPAGVDLANPNVGVTSFQVTIDGVVYGAALTATQLVDLVTTQQLATLLNTSFNTQNASVHVEPFNSTTLRVVVDKANAVIGTDVSTGTIIAGTGVSAPFQINPTTAFVQDTLSGDRLIYKAYEDRAMNEGVDDNATLGSSISLGADAYAEDLVIDFAADGTRIAEDQSYTIKFADLKSEDKVAVQINGVIYELQVNKNLNGTLVGANQTTSETNDAFVARLAKFINQFMDDDTAVGAVDATAANGTLTLIQRAYNTEETVFMKTPVVTLANLSGGQTPVAVVTNTSSHEVHLLDFDGQHGNLTTDNVLFVGEEFTNRSYLETAKDAGGLMNSTEAVVINAGTDDLAAFAINLASKVVTTSTPTDNYSVHGDDFLLTGKALDTVNAGTGDDRVEGSLGADVLDGGRNYYQVKVLNEAKARVVVMNEWEAASPAARVTSLAGLTISSAKLIGQNESGNTAISGDFNDTLVFQQADFKAGVTDFTVRLDGFTAVTPTLTVRTVEFRNDGAGHVDTDVNGDNVIGTNITTFSNFENIRTVSGVGHAVANDGQGNDTLDVSALSNATFGVSYDLTGNATAGDVWFTTADEVVDAVVANASTAAGDRTVAGDYTEATDVYVIKVDGVENVIGGTGDDLLMIDETEAAKNNSFSAGTGTDRVEYLNDYQDAVDGESEPTVTINVGGLGSSVDTVVMTLGALGLVTATDTLTNVEYIALGGNTAEGTREDDVLNVTAFTAGVVVDYTNGEIRTGQAAGVGVQLVIEGIVELENVWADGDDTVIVANALTMNDNARSDELNPAAPESAAEDIGLATYYDFDATKTVTQGTTTITVRKTFDEQVGALPTSEAKQVINQNQFTFDMSRVGSEADVDTIDYSNELGQITAVMNFAANDNSKYVVVDSDSDAVLTDAGSRVDHLIGVERIVAAQGLLSTIDLTGSDRDVNIEFSYNIPNAKAQFVEGEDKIAALDRQINTVRVSDANNQAALGNVDLIEYRDLGDLNTGATAITQVKAVWETIQGSDNREYVELTQWEDGTNHVFNLRGGQNEVNYNERTNGIELILNSVSATVNGVGNQFDLRINHLDGVGAPLASFDSITSFNTSNTFNEAGGTRLDTLRIEASQGDMDLINVANLGASGVFLLGEVEASGSSVVTALFEGAGAGLTMSGFEYLWDAGVTTGGDPIDDVYVINDLSNFVSKVTLIDFDQNYVAGVFTGSDDRDTIKLTNGAFETAVVRPPVSHSLTIDANLHMGDGNVNDIQWLGVDDRTTRDALSTGEDGVTVGSVGFDFQVLDISAVTATATGGSLAGLITAAGSVINTTDELIVGNLALLNSTTATAITNFDILSLTGAGGSYDLDLTAGQLQTAANVKIVGFTDVETLDVSRTTSANTITVTGGTVAAVVGSAFVDTITGGAGADTITGGAGADVLDGNIVPAAGEVTTYSLTGTTAADAIPANATVAFNGVTLTEGTGFAFGADADTIGSAFTNAIYRDGNLVNGEFTDAATMASVTWDAINNKLVVTEVAGVSATAARSIVVALNGDASPLPLTGGLEVVTTVGAAQGESADTFVYEAATDSTAAAMDEISNFSVGAVDDVIDLSGVGLEPHPLDVVNGGSAYANFADVLADALFELDDQDANVFVGSNGTDTWVIVAQDSHDVAADMVIKLVGIDATGIDGSNFTA